jgi:hypothetical protein
VDDHRRADLVVDMGVIRYDPYPGHLRKKRTSAQVSDHDKAMGEKMMPSALKGAGAGRRNKAAVTLPPMKFTKEEAK